jgi:hypothetical protein
MIRSILNILFTATLTAAISFAMGPWRLGSSAAAILGGTGNCSGTVSVPCKGADPDSQCDSPKHPMCTGGGSTNPDLNCNDSGEGCRTTGSTGCMAQQSQDCQPAS